MVIERINQHFGYNAVARIKLLQAPLRRVEATSGPAKPKIDRRPLSAQEGEAIAARFAHVEDPELRERLIRLGRVVQSRTAATKSGD